jgi:hypothetical protein
MGTSKENILHSDPFRNSLLPEFGLENENLGCDASPASVLFSIKRLCSTRCDPSGKGTKLFSPWLALFALCGE